MTGYVGLRRNRLPNRRPRRGIPDPPCSASPSGVGTSFAKHVALFRTTRKKEGVECPPTFDPWLPQRARGQPCSTPAYAFAHAALSALQVKHGACQVRRALFVSVLRAVRSGEKRPGKARFFDIGHMRSYPRPMRAHHVGAARVQGACVCAAFERCARSRWHRARPAAKIRGRRSRPHGNAPARQANA